jgi:hypothetical protein
MGRDGNSIFRAAIFIPHRRLLDTNAARLRSMPDPICVASFPLLRPPSDLHGRNSSTASMVVRAYHVDEFMHGCGETPPNSGETRPKTFPLPHARLVREHYKRVCRDWNQRYFDSHYPSEGSASSGTGT